MTGNEAVADAAIYAGMRFFAGYPITPSTEIAECLSRRLPTLGGVFIQMEDEIASISAIIGASLAGVKAMTATSGPGFSLMQENIGYASMAEVPIVVVDVQRGGPSTGLPTLPAQADIMQARWGTHGDHPVIAVYPATVPETYAWTVKAFNMAEQYRVPVILLLDEIVAHLNEKTVLPEPGALPVVNRVLTGQDPREFLPYRVGSGMVPEFAAYGTGYRFNVTGLAHDETGFPTNDPVTIDRLLRRLNDKIEKNTEAIAAYREDRLDDAEIAVVACGATARSARKAVKDARAQGIKAGLFQPLVIWPFPVARMRVLATRIRAFLVPELSLGQLGQVTACAIQRDPISLARVDGLPIAPHQILEMLRNV